VALLNAASDGVVITTVVSRDFARMYVKLIRDGGGDIPLAPEEAEAVNQARGSTPFTIRPRVDGAPEEEPRLRAGADAIAEGAPMAAGLPGLRATDDREVERENRRRRRKGLPPVEGKVPASAVGWAEPETPIPPGVSLAEEFVRQRKQRLSLPEDPTAEDEWPPAFADDDGDPRDL
jgi:hypothetical protein